MHTFIRVRALGNWLSEYLDKYGGLETADDQRTEWVEYLRQQLSTIECDLHGITEHVEECFRWLDDAGGMQGMYMYTECVFVY